MNSPFFTAKPHSAPGTPPIRMGRLLIEEGKLDELKAERIAQMQKEKGLRFGEAARAMGLVTEEDIQRVLATQFGYISYREGEQCRASRQVVVAYEPFCAEAEMLRALRSQLMMRWFDTGRKALAVAAIDACTGTSTLVANLAVVFAQLKLRTLVIDANLRQPCLHSLFGLNGNVGLTDMLAGRVGMEAVISPEAIPYLSVLPVGTPVPNGRDLVGHGLYMGLQKTLFDLFDIILVDTPPFSSNADAHAIASRVGGVLVVLRKDRTRMADVAALNAQLSGTGVIGVGSVLIIR